MTIAALDLNADRIWAVSGALGQSPQALYLDSSRPDLALAIAMVDSSIKVGRAALGVVRLTPHRVCRGFLPRLGEQCVWQLGGKQLQPDAAMALSLAKLQPLLMGSRGLVLAVPPYLSREQVALLVRLCQQAGLPAMGAVSRSLAAALSCYADHPSHQVGLVVDVDDHAFTCTIVRPTETEMICQGKRSVTALGLRVWKEKLLSRVADLCIRVCRRDPRQSPEADQSVFDQIDNVLEGCSQNRSVPVRVQATDWYQTLSVHPAEAAAACGVLAAQAAEVVKSALAWAEQQMSSPMLWLTAGAARLPALAAAIYARCSNRMSLAVLPASAIAQAAHSLAERIQAGELAPCFFDPMAPLPLQERTDTPPMLQFPQRLRQTADELI